MRPFYITIPSNDIRHGQSNTLADFKIELPENKNLSEDDEVGLASISYTLSWFNFPFDNLVGLTMLGREWVYHVDVLPAGRYDDVAILIKKINTILEEGFNRHDQIKSDYRKDKIIPKIEFDEISKRFTLTEGTTGYGLDVHAIFSKNLIELLGFPFKYDEDYSQPFKKEHNGKVYEMTVLKSVTTSESRPFDITGGIHSLFVYSDIIDYEIVGSTRAQLLRLVEIPNERKFSDQVNLPFPRPQYKPLLYTKFSSIEISIKDDAGRPIPFQFGRIYITLHFRRSKDAVRVKDEE